MNTETGIIRELFEGEKPKPKEVLINQPKSDCSRCKGKGAIPRSETIRAERRRAEKKGVPPNSNYYPCPECGGY